MEEKKQIMSREIRHFRKKNPKIADTIIKNSSFSKSKMQNEACIFALPQLSRGHNHTQIAMRNIHWMLFQEHTQSWQL